MRTGFARCVLPAFPVRPRYADARCFRICGMCIASIGVYSVAYEPFPCQRWKDMKVSGFPSSVLSHTKPVCPRPDEDHHWRCDCHHYRHHCRFHCESDKMISLPLGPLPSRSPTTRVLYVFTRLSGADVVLYPCAQF